MEKVDNEDSMVVKIQETGILQFVQVFDRKAAMAIETGFRRDASTTEPKCFAETIDAQFGDAQRRLRSDLLDHLGKLVNQADLSDLEIICSDGVSVKASKLLLVGRSPVFDKMLTNGMRESSQSVIKLPEISSPVLLYLLDILYAGNSLHHPLVSWKMGLEALSAANFFILPDAIKVVRKFLWVEVTKVTAASKFPEAASMLSAAMEFTCIIPYGDGILQELVPLIRRGWLTIKCAVNLSEEAAACILESTEINLDQAFSLTEYYHFRRVLFWCLLHDQANPDSAVETVALFHFSMPFKKADLYKVGDTVTSETQIVWLPDLDEFNLKDGRLCELLSRRSCKDAFARLRKYVEWCRIPAALMVNIIGPMRILPSSQYLDITRTHAVEQVELSQANFYCKWMHGGSYTTETRGFVIRKSENRRGFAVCQTEEPQLDSLLKWRFCVDRIGAEGLEVGLARGKREHLSEMEDEWPNKIAFVCLMKIMTLEKGCISIHPHNRKYPSELDISSPITILMTFDPKSFACTAQVDGHDISGRRVVNRSSYASTAHDILPAVNLGSVVGSQVRIEFGSGYLLL